MSLDLRHEGKILSIRRLHFIVYIKNVDDSLFDKDLQVENLRFLALHFEDDCFKYKKLDNNVISWIILNTMRNLRNYSMHCQNPANVKINQWFIPYSKIEKNIPRIRFYFTLMRYWNSMQADQQRFVESIPEMRRVLCTHHSRSSDVL